MISITPAWVERLLVIGGIAVATAVAGVETATFFVSVLILFLLLDQSNPGGEDA